MLFLAQSHSCNPTSCITYQSIGAVNTIVRRSSDGKLIGYNTDCEASITAIEDSIKGAEADNKVSLAKVAYFVVQYMFI